MDVAGLMDVAIVARRAKAVVFFWGVAFQICLRTQPRGSKSAPSCSSCAWNCVSARRWLIVVHVVLHATDREMGAKRKHSTGSLGETTASRRDNNTGTVHSVHVKGHSADGGNDRVDEEVHWGKGDGPYTRLRDGEGGKVTATLALRARDLWRRARHSWKQNWQSCSLK
eukprot:SAG31_NODE_2905_length_4925_cov_85.303357_3_plen_169_part_00